MFNISITPQFVKFFVTFFEFDLIFLIFGIKAKYNLVGTQQIQHKLRKILQKKQNITFVVMIFFENLHNV